MHACFLLHNHDLLIDSDVRSQIEVLAARAAYMDRPSFWGSMHKAAADLAVAGS
jgi:hypothetical protein